MAVRSSKRLRAPSGRAWPQARSGRMSDSQKREERMTYMSLVGLFMTLLGAFAFRERGQKRAFTVDPRDLALFGLATYRASRLVAYDRVAEPFRDPVTETVPDEYHAGENVVAE